MARNLLVWRQELGGASAVASDLAAAEGAARVFVERVANVPEVTAVYMVDLQTALGVWTVLDTATGAASAWTKGIRDAVYGHQLALLREQPAAEIDFRLIDVAELRQRRLADVLPTGARLLWARAASSA